MDHLCFFVCLLFLMLLRLFIAALWSAAGKVLTSWLLLMIFFCIFVIFPCGILGQMWYLIVSFPGLCRLSYLNMDCPILKKYNALVTGNMRSRRSVGQFREMISTTSNLTMTQINGYGRYCGFRGSGIPIDNIDRWVYSYKTFFLKIQ